MKWVAVVPLKAEPLRKSRLAAALPLKRRVGLSEALYRHVLACIEGSGLFKDSVTLSPTPPPHDVPGRWQSDEGLEVNAALARIRTAIRGPLMVINSDLPLLRGPDLKALAATAERRGCAIAADRHGMGTNAVAILPKAPFSFAFGPGSLKAHLELSPGARILRRIGLSYDLDTKEDITAVLRSGRRLPPEVARWLKPAKSE
jgi:2-phospho-L-lactate guanylyltransferase